MFNEIGNMKFDIIISNPPYISENEYKNLEPELYHEPKLALVAEDDGLVFYKRILCEVKNYLTNNGELYLEIGCEQAKKIIEIANSYGLKNYKIISDLTGRERVVSFQVIPLQD